MNRLVFALFLESGDESEEEYVVNIRAEKRFLRNKYEVLDIPEKRFIESFRVNKEIFRYLLSEISPYYIEERRNSDRTVSLSTKLAAVLNFYATGSYQRTLGDVIYHSANQSVISKSITQITNILEQTICKQWIKFPDDEEILVCKKQFFEKTGIPGIIGAVDGTHVAMIAPTENEHMYVNRKGYHSLNVQLVCNYYLQIYSVNARYPGSAHDAAIWALSADRKYLESKYNNGDHNSWLLGDSGYPLEPWLITLFKGNLTEAQNKFNETHAKARNPIERCNGVLKGRFRCLLGERKLRYDPLKVIKIINVCCALHIICIFHNIHLEETENMGNEVHSNNETEDNNESESENNNIREIAVRTRNRITNLLS